MITLEFSTTAMCRPGLLRRTYKSFCSKMKGVDFENSTLYLNVDPLPSVEQADDTIAVAKKFFGNVVSNVPKEPNFTAAVKWCWSNVTGPYVFHLEDDWLLRQKVDVELMCKRLTNLYKDKHKVVQVYLRAYPGISREKICLSPSLLDGDLVRRAVQIFNTSLNPEIQLRGTVVQGISLNHTKAILIKDIGRAWLNKTNFGHPPRKARFTSWITKR